MKTTPHPRHCNRGASALEVVFVMAALALLLGPVLELTQGSRRAAAFEENQVVGRRQAERTLAILASRSYADLKGRAEAPLGELPVDPRILPDSLEVRLPVRNGADVLLDALDPDDADLAIDRLARCRVFWIPLKDGLARLSAYVWWPSGAGQRGLVVSRLVEDPLAVGGGA